MLTLEKKLRTRVKTAAKRLGIGEHEIMNRAVSSYLVELDEWRRLQDELRAWDTLSADALHKHNF